jgi:hypothetical protein
MTQHQNYEVVNYSGSVRKFRNAKTAFFDYEMNVMNFYRHLYGSVNLCFYNKNYTGAIIFMLPF